MQKMKNRAAILTLTFMAAFVPLASSSGTEWPQRTVHIIVPLPAGADAPVRAFAEPLAKRWKQPIVIENRPGADGIIGVAAFTGVQHDDHTLLYYSAAAISTFPVTHQKLPYDPTRDVVPISSVVDGSIFMQWGAARIVETPG
jgi:tripartite-type tricarboxylate transporter receptor subunit TctC